MKIGEILVKNGCLTAADVDRALELQQKSPGRLIGTILIEIGAVSEEELLSCLSAQLGIPFRKELTRVFVPETANLLPFEFWQKWTALPIRDQGRIFVVSPNPVNLPRLEIERKLNEPIELALGLSDEIAEVLAHNYWRPTQEKPRSDASIITEPASGETDATRENLLDLANKAPVIRLVNQIIFQALQQRASDIHLQPQESEFRVRYRVDGLLHDVFKLTPQMHQAVISRIKILSALNIAERRLPQDGRTTVHLKDRPIDIRISILPTTHGEAAVLRLLDQSASLFGLDTIGFYADEMARFEQLIAHDHGIILLTGPTGSGKTTTLYAALQKINLPGRNIVTLEDPVEYQIPGLSQIQVNPPVGLTFAAGLRSILRHDPDILMIGEIRDRETADMAIQASLTGHLVFSTLHTNDATSAVARLTEMGIEPYLLSSSLLAVIAQRLVRLLCPKCLMPPGTASPDARPTKGCDYCFQTGYRGRTGIFELFVLDDTTQQMVNQKRSGQEIKEFAIRNGMRTLRTSGEMKISEGLTTLQEVLRVTT